ncbi:MAG TPA: Ig-like domain repeat protein, partial [Acidimicrobiales bacterium]|nr:Ig-like domain repeat protein [Acidimicrobiales bacterium]
SDQKVVVAGSANGNADFGLARLGTDGTLDTSFGTGVFVDTPVGGSAGSAYGVAVQGDGNIVAVGQSGDDNPGDHLNVAVARYTSAGALDTSFGTAGIAITPIGTNQDAAGRAVALQTDGQIVVGGYFQAAVGGDDLALLRYNASNGQLDTSFGTGGIVTTNTGGSDDFGNAVALEPGSLGAIVVAGSDQPSGGSPQFLLARYLAALPPAIAKAFGAASIPVGGTTSLTLTITNPGTGAMTGVSFTDSLPAGLVVATPHGLTSTCSGTATATAASSTVSLTGGTIAAGSSCSVVVNVTGTSAGVKNNSVSVSSDSGAGNTANASITVVAPPTLSKAFGAASVPLGGSTSLSFTVNNPNATTDLTGIGFTDSLPSGLTVATPNGLTGTCGTGTITAIAGSGSVSLAGGTVAASGSCTFSVNVTASSAGAKNNTTGAVTSTEGGTGGTASASLAVVAPPTIAKSFSPAAIVTGSTSSLTFTITNPAANSVALTGVAFTDTLPTGLTVPTATASTCGGTLTTTNPTGIALTGATIATNSACQFSVTVTGAVNGSYTNTTGAVSSTNGGTGNTASAGLGVETTTATVVSSSLNPSAFGQTVVFTATVSPVPAGGTVGFTDGGASIAGCSAVAVSSGSAACSVSTESVGSHSIVATYSGTPSFLGSVSPTLTQTVHMAPPATTSPTVTTVSSSVNPSVVGQTVVYTAHPSPLPPANGAPTGTVAFTDGGSTISGCGAAAVSAGSATCTVTYGSTGTHTIVATYSGDANFASSSSASLTQTVVHAPTGYTLAAADGTTFAFGSASPHGPVGGSALSAPVVGIASTPDGQGYWLVGADGAVYPFGDAHSFGSEAGKPLNAPVVGMAAAPDGQGYWLVAADGGVFSFGSAQFAGSEGGKPLNAPMVGMAAAPDGQGYWLVAADGGIFTFGSAPFAGSEGGKPLNAPVVGMAAAPDGLGYWLVAADGGIFTFGSAPFAGSEGGKPLNAPVVGMAAAPDGQGYWLVAADGGVFTFGSAQFAGSEGGKPLNAPMVGMAS